MAYRPKDVQERIVHRLKITDGHLKKIIEMIEKDVYCIDVMQQLKAVEKNIKATSLLLLENHLKTCVSDAFKKGNKEKSVSEIIQIFRSNE